MAIFPGPLLEAALPLPCLGWMTQLLLAFSFWRNNVLKLRGSQRGFLGHSDAVASMPMEAFDCLLYKVK